MRVRWSRRVRYPRTCVTSRTRLNERTRLIRRRTGIVSRRARAVSARAVAAGRAAARPARRSHRRRSGGRRRRTRHRTVRAHERPRLVERVGCDRTAEQRPEPVARRRLQRTDDREVVDALDEVVASRLAELLVGRHDVEHVVDDLERHPVAQAVLRERVDVDRAAGRRRSRRCGTPSRTATRSCPRSPDVGVLGAVTS